MESITFDKSFKVTKVMDKLFVIMDLQEDFQNEIKCDPK
jgi:predicted DNA-binding protein (MmcQ/YjbR family)